MSQHTPPSMASAAAAPSGSSFHGFPPGGTTTADPLVSPVSYTNSCLELAGDTLGLWHGVSDASASCRTPAGSSAQMRCVFEMCSDSDLGSFLRFTLDGAFYQGVELVSSVKMLAVKEKRAPALRVLQTGERNLPVFVLTAPPYRTQGLEPLSGVGWGSNTWRGLR